MAVKPIPGRPANSAIPLSDVGGNSGTTYADNDPVGLAGQPVSPQDVKKAAIQRRMQTALQSNVSNTGSDNNT